METESAADEARPIPSPPASTPRPSTRPGGLRDSLSVLSNFDFRLLLLSNIAMFGGYQIRTMAQAWVVLDLTNSSLKAGIVNAMPGTGIFFLSLFAGALADRSERWWILVWTRTVIAAAAFFTAFLITIGVLEWWHLIPIGLLTGSMFAFHNPASQAYAVDVVGRERLLSAASLNTTFSNVATVGGPALGGYLLAIGADVAFYLLGAMYGVAFLSTFPMRARSGRRPSGRNLRVEIADGLRYAWGVPVIKWLLVLALAGVFNGVFQAMMPVFARNVLGVGEVGYGTMLAAQGAGALTASLSLVLLGNIQWKGPLIFANSMLLSGSMLVLAASDTFGLAIFASYLFGVSMGVWFITIPTVLQMSSSNEMRGRVMGLFFMIALIFQQGWIIGGVLETSLGPQAAALIAATGSAAITLVVYAASPSLRKLR